MKILQKVVFAEALLTSGFYHEWQKLANPN